MPSLGSWRVAGIASAASLWATVAQARQPRRSLCEGPTNAGIDPVPGAELRLVQVVFRHGARTPLTLKYWDGATWEKGKDCGELEGAVQLALSDLAGGPQPACSHDARQAATVFPGGCTKGELTLLGQRQARDLGAWLRDRYVNQAGFLPPNFEEGTVTGRSTNYRRTIATLRGVLTGLYPDAGRPIPAVVAEDVDEVLFGNAEACKRLGGMLKVMQNNLREGAKKDSRLQKLQEQLRGALGLEDDHRMAFLDLHDALTSMAAHGKALPAGLDPELVAEVNKEATRRMAAMVAPVRGPHDEAVRLSMGRLFEQVVGRMEIAASNKPEPLMFLYSGHDTTLMPLMATLGIDLEWWPDYASNLVFELWEEAPHSGQYLVRVLHNRKEVPLGPNDETVMGLEEFKDVFFKPYLLTRDEYHTECAVEFQHADSAPQPETVTAAGSAVQGM